MYVDIPVFAGTDRFPVDHEHFSPKKGLVSESIELLSQGVVPLVVCSIFHALVERCQPFKDSFQQIPAMTKGLGHLLDDFLLGCAYGILFFSHGKIYNTVRGTDQSHGLDRRCLPLIKCYTSMPDPGKIFTVA